MSQAEDILAELRAGQGREEATFTQGGTQSLAEGLMGNLLGIPEMIAQAGRFGGNAVRIATGNERLSIPPGGLLDMPTGREALAGIESVPNLLGFDSPPFDENMARRNQVESDAPMGSLFGSLGADVATIATGRKPLVKGPGGVLDKAVSEGVSDLGSFFSRKAGKTGIRRFTTDIVKSDVFKDIAKAFGRSAETGIEGAALAVLQGGDPIETAALSMGGQLAASFALTMAKETIDLPFAAIGAKPKGIKGKAAALVMNAMIAGGLWQLFKSMTPGGRDRILESKESGFQKIAGALFLGMTLGLAGKRSKPDGVLKAFPHLADATNAIPRVAMLKLMVELSKDESGIGEQTLDTVMKNPLAFTESQLDELLAGIQDGSLVDRAKKLSEDDDFLKLIEAIHPKLANVPERDE